VQIKIPELSLVALIGTSGSGKSTFAKKHFLPTEVISSDACRALVSDDENNLDATNDAFDLLYEIARKRLKRGNLVVVDATNVGDDARKPIIKLAREYHVIPVAIVLNIPEKFCQARNTERSDRNFGPHVIQKQNQQLRRSIRNLKREGFRHIYIMDSPEEVEQAFLTREPLWNNKKHEHGPFDIIGDIHGCFDELSLLLNDLGYHVHNQPENELKYTVAHPEGRRLIFLGDLVDRGPKTADVLKLVMSAVQSGSAFCVPGNHDQKLLKKLLGKGVQIKHGLAETLEQLSHEPLEFHNKVRSFIDSLVSHYVLDDSKLVVAHAGLKEEMQGRGSGAVREFCLYGETTGETDEFGLPVRYNWALDYRGKAMVVYGHTPVPEVEWLNRTINIDTGCVFGGRLSALRYPEKEIISVNSLATYADPIRPLILEPDPQTLSAQQIHDDILDIDDVIGKHIVSTRIGNNIIIREENSIAALEVMSRFAVDPKWLIYLPPTMSPTETSKLPDLLEHPTEAFTYYRNQGIDRVVCEEKHMGSRAIVVICKDEEAARKRFGVEEHQIGICYTRTGRNFFNDPNLEREFLALVRDGISSIGYWEEFETDWMCVDCELMPWSAKAQSLLVDQYAAVGKASEIGLKETVKALEETIRNGKPVNELLQRFTDKMEMSHLFTDSYRRYCWPMNSINDLKLAPFHILATEGAVHTNKPHTWHMEKIHKLCSVNEHLFRATKYMIVDLSNEESVNQGVNWWQDMTSIGGEGMVLKPMDFIVRGKKGLVQPAIKCRGKEYLRIIYGPEYTAPENMERLKSRGISAKRSLALREFALSIESLERFVGKEPLRRVHECAFGLLALESEPVDPRL
jgi:protein phosphatase